MDFDRLRIRFRQFGGLRLIREYKRLGVLGKGIKAFFRCLVKRQSFKAIYPEILTVVEPFLEIRYYHILHDSKKHYENSSYEQRRNKIIWFCWLQGMEQAPAIVKACYHSYVKNLTEWDIKVIDNRNWKDFVSLPEYIVKKWENGRIPAANFSDLLRLELLIKYGGTWVDATVLCTGFDTQETQKDLKYLDTDLFLFQYTPEGTTEGISISNWFITACTNNEVLMVLRDMLFAYWKDYDCTLDYYIFHLFFEIVAREYREQILSMPYGNSMRSLTLGKHWREPFCQEKWDRLVSRVPFHKISYRLSEKNKKDKNNYYHWILKLYG